MIKAKAPALGAAIERFFMNSNSPDLGTAIASTTANNVKLLTVNLVLLSFMGVALVAAILCTDSVGHAATVALWALACLAVGAFFGLLFGVPRPRPAVVNDGTKEPVSAYQPNNNLIEISDWLTKIIVGVGLIELSSLPEKLKMMAGPLRDCLHAECGLAVAVAILVYFTTSGFLAGYINARTFIAVLLKESDDQLGAIAIKVGKERAVQEQAVDELETIGQRAVPETVPSEAPPETHSERAGPDPAVLRMAADYASVRQSDYRERVAAKDRIAAEMATYLVRKAVPKARLVGWIESDPTDGLIIALASYVIAKPESGDLSLLLRATKKARLLHVKYRVCLAIRTLFRLSFGEPEEWNQAITLLEDYRDHAKGRHDASLLALSQELLELISTR